MAIDSSAKRRNVANMTIRVGGTSLSPTGSITANDKINGIWAYVGYTYGEPIPDDVAVLFNSGLQVTTGIYM